ncbi:uncharacterized protein DEA37_0012948 [Paragonimus westermani]|uniref:Uncharacterized protein n=1 Tax=Paragonimus westermani TaxID=34504 RepID=A0A5J4P355_9TREM|nr:uncharacterized protein DEA37_0012948 [Paragonimus westermani]
MSLFARQFCRTISHRFRGRLIDKPLEIEVNREADAFRLLTNTDQVRLHLKSLDPQVRQKHLSGIDGDTTVVKSDLVRKIAREFRLHLTLIDTQGDFPLFKLISQPASANQVLDKVGVKLNKGERGKIIRINVNIDDHMLGVRVKQAQTFIESSYVVIVIVRLPGVRTAVPERLSSSDGSPPLNGKQPSKLASDIEARRFVSAFEKIPGAVIRLIERPNSKEILFFLRPATS